MLFLRQIKSLVFSGLSVFKRDTSSSAAKMTKSLAAFDFDHTIIDDNSDTAVGALVDNKIPDDIKVLHKKDGWTSFMQGVFKFLYDNNKTKEQITTLIQNLPAVNGMCLLINRLNELNYDIIIISDSNSYFIDVWLEHNKLSSKIFDIFTNPAEFVNGMLKISMHHEQDHCRLSTKNLCKGQILEDFIRGRKQEGIVYDRVMYCGDGANDFCPILKLGKQDYACVREGFKCENLVKKAQTNTFLDENGAPYHVEAQVISWTDGYDILHAID